MMTAVMKVLRVATFLSHQPSPQIPLSFPIIVTEFSNDICHAKIFLSSTTKLSNHAQQKLDYRVVQFSFQSST